MKKYLQSIGFMSLLDLMACGFGAAILIFLLSVVEEKSDKTDTIRADFVIVRLNVEAGRNAELGLEFKSPNMKKWENCRHSKKEEFTFFTSKSSSTSGGASIFILKDPKVGDWKFRAFIADYPRDHKNLKSDSITVCFTVYGDAKSISGEKSKASKVGIKVGDVTQPFEILIKRKLN